MLKGGEFFNRQFAAHFGILSLLQVGQEVLLCLSALIIAVLFGVHSQFKQFFVVLSILPTVLVHLLLKLIQAVWQQRMWVGIGKFESFFLGQSHQFGCDCSRNFATLAQNHTPHRIVHHHETPLALLHCEEVHQRNVLHILREWRYEGWITHAWPNVFHLVEEVDKHVVGRQFGLALLRTDAIDGAMYAR